MKGRRLLLWLPLVLLLVIQLGPVLVIVLTSFKTQLSLLDQTGILSWAGFSLENYLRVLVDDDFLTYVWTSTRIAAFSTLASVLLATPAAFALTRIQFPGRKMLAATILCSRMIPPVALAIPVFLLLGAMGATDSEPGLILAHMTFNLPFAVWLMLPFFDSIPRDFEHAAIMDGAGELQVFWHIMVPLALPGMLATASQFGKPIGMIVHTDGPIGTGESEPWFHPKFPKNFEPIWNDGIPSLDGNCFPANEETWRIHTSSYIATIKTGSGLLKYHNAISDIMVASWHKHPFSAFNLDLVPGFEEFSCSGNLANIMQVGVTALRK